MKISLARKSEAISYILHFAEVVIHKVFPQIFYIFTVLRFLLFFENIPERFIFDHVIFSKF